MRPLRRSKDYGIRNRKRDGTADPSHRRHRSVRRHSQNVIIGPSAVIGPNCEIGEGTVIGPNVVIAKNVRMGRGNHIYPGAVIGEDPQDLKFHDEYSTVVLGDGNLIRECVTIHRATGENCETRIGSHTMLQAYVHIAHNCNVGSHVVMSGYSGLAGHVTIEDRAVIGGMTGIHQFVKVGKGSMVGGMSKIVQDVCPFCIVDGNPAHAVGLNVIGLSRNGVAPEVRRDLKRHTASSSATVSSWSTPSRRSSRN